MANKFPIKIGFKIPKVKINGSSVLRCSFDPDFNRTSANSYSFLYDFKEGLLLEADSAKDIYLPNEREGFMTSCYGIQSEDFKSFINFQSGSIEDAHEVKDKERDVIEENLDGVDFKALCIAVLTAMR